MVQRDKHGEGLKTEHLYDHEYGLHGGVEVYQRHTRLSARRRYTALMTAGVGLLVISLLEIVFNVEWNGTSNTPTAPTNLPVNKKLTGTARLPFAEPTAYLQRARKLNIEKPVHPGTPFFALVCGDAVARSRYLK